MGQLLLNNLNLYMSSTFIYKVNEYQSITWLKIVQKDYYVLLVCANIPKLPDIWSYGNIMPSNNSGTHGPISSQQVRILYFTIYDGVLK